MMKNKLKLALVAASAGLSLAGCSNSPTSVDIAEREAKAQQVRQEAAANKIEQEQKLAKEMVNSVPEWAISPPQPDSEGIYAVGMGDSQKLHTAIKKANLEAQYALAKAYQQELSGNERSYTQDNGNSGLTEQYTQLIDTLVDNVPVVGFRVIEQEVIPLQGRINAYVLVKLPYDQFNTMLQQKKSEAANTDIKNAFDELEIRLEKRRQARIEESKLTLDKASDKVQDVTDSIITDPDA
ncbi:LPP20 family lipoprotein [Vibrio parahaemolyticus]|uniref:LPP20 family lipoprotein n=1 Tax=Vibrio parahaemolyticus TaxID=670 RepID=UPI0008134D53|nr:LPP20 family lipoprotein [Vibrio parahaemolyticus]OCQ07868.1 hypothetical protein AKH09_11805 [Vibrio parahaemolyticus]